MKTIKLYDEDSMMFSFEGIVVGCEKTDDGMACVELEATAFFPEAGGQSADIGRLGDLAVKDVRIDDDGRIVHICEIADGLLPKPGERIPCAIDGKRRLSFMRHHTAEHMFSGLVKKYFGYNNCGFHLSDHICTMDYDGPLSDADIKKLEKEVNELILSDKRVHTFYPSDEQLSALDYRCKGELSPPIRIVEIEDADVCACCAPHVKHTSQIGVFFVQEASSYKGGIRLSILVGMKAFSFLRDCSRLLHKTAASLSVGTDGLPDSIDKQKNDIATLKRKLADAQNAILKSKAEQIPSDSKNAILFCEEADDAAAREIINSEMPKRDGLCGVFIGNDKDGYRFVLGSGKIDMRVFADELRKKFSAKCGGSKTMISGKISSTKTEIENEGISCI